jgi:hypothetical protein
MRNHVIAEMMFRHDPRATLYTPLWTPLLEVPTGGALASLLEALDVPVPAPLVAAASSNTQGVQDPAFEYRKDAPW